MVGPLSIAGLVASIAGLGATFTQWWQKRRGDRKKATLEHYLEWLRRRDHAGLVQRIRSAQDTSDTLSLLIEQLKTASVDHTAELLARLDRQDEVEIDRALAVTPTNAEPGITMTIPPDTVMGEDHEMYSGIPAVSEVPIGFAPASLPKAIQRGLVVTIHPIGLTFAQPVPITILNVDNLTPGSEVDFWSLDHATGEFFVAGRGQVSPERFRQIVESQGRCVMEARGSLHHKRNRST